MWFAKLVCDIEELFLLHQRFMSMRQDIDNYLLEKKIMLLQRLRK
jgi:hypothetical protein